MTVDTILGLGLLPRRDVLRIASALALIPFFSYQYASTRHHQFSPTAVCYQVTQPSKNSDLIVVRSLGRRQNYALLGHE